MSTWDVVNVITIIGAILAPITTFVFLAMGLFNVSSAMKKHGVDNQLLAQQLAQKDTLLTYLLTNSIRNGGFGGGIAQQNTQRQEQDFVEYGSANADFYTPSSVPLIAANKRAELKNAQATVPIARNSGFWIGLLSGACVFLITLLILVILVILK